MEIATIIALARLGLQVATSLAALGNKTVQAGQQQIDLSLLDVQDFQSKLDVAGADEKTLKAMDQALAQRRS